MSGEYASQVGGDFVSRVCALLDNRYGFHVFQVSGMAPDAASVPEETGNNRIRFDILLDQTRIDNSHNPPIEKKMYFYCECKWRTSTNDLKAQLKEFLIKALKASPALQRQHSNDFGFIFISNKPFGVDQTDLETVSYISQLLDDRPINVEATVRLCSKIGILFVSDWFLQTTARGRIRRLR